MKKLALVLITLVIFISCKTDDSITSELITITLKSNISGTLSNSPTIEYRDISGVIQSEMLSVGTWEKSLSVTRGFLLFVKATGTLNGSIQLTASAKGNRVSFNDNRNLDINVDTNFNLEISTTL